MKDFVDAEQVIGHCQVARPRVTIAYLIQALYAGTGCPGWVRRGEELSYACMCLAYVKHSLLYSRHVWCGSIQLIPA